MAKFLVTAKDNSGHVFNEVVESINDQQAVKFAQQKGLFVTAVKQFVENQQPVTSVAKKRVFSHNNISLNDVVSFARQLSAMMGAGVLLMRSLKIISSQLESRGLTVIIEAVVTDVEQGRTFSSAISKYPKVFTAFWVSLIEVGEASGTLPKVLNKLTQYMEDTAKFKSTIIGALVYPMVLCFICIGAVLFFALFVGPTFERIFSDMDIKLPTITVIMMSIFKLLKERFFILIAGGAGSIFLFMNYIKTPLGRKQFETFLFKVPIFGGMIKLIVIEKFTSQMSTLMESGVPILYSLEISERLVDNVVCAEVIRNVREAVREGQLLADPMERSGFFPSMTVQMIRVGEETGELGKMLNNVAIYYKANVEEFLKRFSILIEPVMLVIMGGVIGLIVIAMFLPILSLSTGG